MTAETTAPTTGAAHKCSFPCNPPGGSFFAPGPCECGKTYAQDEADSLLADAVTAMLHAYGGGWASAVPGSIISALREAGKPLDAPEAAELASGRRAVRTLAAINGANMRAMEAARIEMRQNGPHAGMQWILSSLPDLWDDPGTEWDGEESAQAWFDRTRSEYEAPQEQSAEEGR